MLTTEQAGQLLVIMWSSVAVKCVVLFLSVAGCVYNGQIYRQGMTWDRGCEYRCECVDAVSGQYRCTDRYLNFFFSFSFRVLLNKSVEVQNRYPWCCLRCFLVTVLLQKKT